MSEISGITPQAILTPSVQHTAPTPAPAKVEVASSETPSRAKSSDSVTISPQAQAKIQANAPMEESKESFATKSQEKSAGIK